MKTVMLSRREMLKSFFTVFGCRVAGAASGNPTSAGDPGLMVAAAGFDQTGGWLLDTQFIDTMGSPYLIAHGLGVPVANATSLVRLPHAGKWRVWVRTMDWVARWKAFGAPGRFQLLIDRIPLKSTFGDSGSQWHWQDGGIVEISKPEITLALHDLTGFNGRCEAIYFTQNLTTDPPAQRPLSFKVSSSNQPTQDFDLVVAGGGYAGMAAALSAGRMGLKTALVQNRPVLGGNASSEIHVPPRGLMPENGPYPRLGRLVRELQFDQNVESRLAVETDDLHYEQVLRAEKNIHLFLSHHVCAAETEGDRLTGLWMLDTHAGSQTLITGRLFADCTGHATLGALAGAEWVIGAGPVANEQHRREFPLMGMTNKWRWTWTDVPSAFPETPWALDLSLDDFPLHQADLWGSWRWESGFYRHPIDDLEYIRDWNLRAVFGAWNAVKNKEKSKAYAKARLSGVAAIGGTRESRRLIGDYVLTAEDILNRSIFEDGFVPVSWYLDRHIPHRTYNRRYPDAPFIAENWESIKDTRRPRHSEPWWGIPYRCLYSRNIGNLFMAGRNISTDYLALGPVRVMRTCGMMGEVVGQAAAVCADKKCLPRAVYQDHLQRLKQLLS